MGKYKVKVVQVFRVEREIIVEVEATHEMHAVGIQEDEGAPPYDDPRWKETRTLENEEVIDV